MKRFIAFSILLMAFLCSSSAQTIAEFEGILRISAISPQFQLFDNDAGEERVEGSLYEANDDIVLLSNYGRLWLFAQDDRIELSSHNITTTNAISDFMIRHESGNSAEHGFTLRNNGGNDNDWTFYVLNGTGNMSLTRNGAVVGTFASNGIYTASDRRLKRDIEPLDPVLSRLLTLRTKKYNYIASDNPEKSIGFVAQDVKKHFPELVLDGPMDEGEAVMQVNYAGFGVLAIKAIQEQQDQIDRQGQRIEAQEESISSQELTIASQEQMIKVQSSALQALEAQVNNLMERTAVLEKEKKGL